MRKRDCIFDKKTFWNLQIIKLHQIIQREQYQNIYLKDEKEGSRNHSSKHLRLTILLTIVAKHSTLDICESPWYASGFFTFLE